MARHKNINWNFDDARAPRNCGPPNPENNSSAIRDRGAAANESRLAGPTQSKVAENFLGASLPHFWVVRIPEPLSEGAP